MAWSRKKKIGFGLVVLVAVPVLAVATLPLWFPEGWVREQLVAAISQATGGKTEIGGLDLKIGLRTGVALRDVSVRFGGDAYPPVSVGALDGTLPLGALVRGRPAFEFAADELNGGALSGRIGIDLSGARPFEGTIRCDKVGIEQDLMAYLAGVLPFPTLDRCAADAKVSLSFDYRGEAHEETDALIASLTGEGWLTIDPLNLQAHPFFGDLTGPLLQAVEGLKDSWGEEKTEKVLGLLRELQLPLAARAEFTVTRERIENVFSFRARSHSITVRGGLARPTPGGPPPRIRYEFTADSFSDPDLQEFWRTYVGDEPHVVEGTPEGVDPGLDRLLGRIAENAAREQARREIEQHGDEARDRVRERANEEIGRLFR